MGCRSQCEGVVLIGPQSQAGNPHPLPRLVLKALGPLELQVGHAWGSWAENGKNQKACSS